MPKDSTKSKKITSLLQKMFKLQQDVDSLLTETAGVGLSAYRILSVVDKQAALPQRRIAGLLGQTEANISRQIRHMAEQGLVKIAPDKKDKRQRNITRTSKGDHKFAKAEELLVKHQAEILKTLK
jgi:DNA-binding MarR family transcriptional regulator